jgi:flagellar protein FlaG
VGSVSVSTLVLFIASLVVAAGVAGTLVTTVEDISMSAETTGDEISENIDTDFRIINDGKGDNFYVEDDVTGTSSITLYVKNTGSTDLNQDASRIDILVNGRLITDIEISSTRTGTDPDVWLGTEVIEIVVHLDNQLSSDNRVTVSVNGVDRSVEFRA